MQIESFVGCLRSCKSNAGEILSIRIRMAERNIHVIAVPAHKKKQDVSPKKDPATLSKHHVVPIDCHSGTQLSVAMNMLDSGAESWSEDEHVVFRLATKTPSKKVPSQSITCPRAHCG